MIAFLGTPAGERPNPSLEGGRGTPPSPVHSIFFIPLPFLAPVNQPPPPLQPTGQGLGPSMSNSLLPRHGFAYFLWAGDWVTEVPKWLLHNSLHPLNEQTFLQCALVQAFTICSVVALEVAFYALEGLQYVAPGPDEKDANVYFLPQKNSSELKFVL